MKRASAMHTKGGAASLARPSGGLRTCMMSATSVTSAEVDSEAARLAIQMVVRRLVDTASASRSEARAQSQPRTDASRCCTTVTTRIPPAGRPLPVAAFRAGTTRAPAPAPAHLDATGTTDVTAATTSTAVPRMTSKVTPRRAPRMFVAVDNAH
jgi:hypothetical protein